MRRATILLLLAVLLGSPAVAQADDAQPAASWTQLRRTTPLGSSPDAAAGGLAVQNTAAGVTAYSAVRAMTSADEAVLRLSLVGDGVGTLVVWACPATGPWTAGTDQAWDARPSYDCTQHAVGTVDGSHVSWQVTPSMTAATGRLDLVLVPDPASTDPLSVEFAPPDAASFLIYRPGASAPAAATEQSVPAAPIRQSAPLPLRAEAPFAGGLAAPPPVAAAQIAPLVQSRVSPGEQPVAAALSAATRRSSAPRTWLGPALLALLALLLMTRLALPSKPLAAPTSLLRRPDSGSTRSPQP